MVKKLDNQIKIRETLVNDKVRYENQLREAKSHDPEEHKEFYKSYNPILKGIEKVYFNSRKIKGLIKQGNEISKTLNS